MTSKSSTRKRRPTGTAKATAKRPGISDRHVHERIFSAIINHHIPPGTALLEDGLAKAFGVSRTVIRKVLQKLSHERLVDMVPNKGASVAKPSAEEARQVFEARREVERVLVHRAVSSASESDLKHLVKLAKSEQLAHIRGEKAERLRLSGIFHRQLANYAGNGVLENFLGELVSRTSLIIALYESPGAVPCSHTEHMEIANAIMSRDAAKAAEYMEHHLRHIEAQIDLTSNTPAPDFETLFSQQHKRKKTHLTKS